MSPTLSYAWHGLYKTKNRTIQEQMPSIESLKNDRFPRLLRTFSFRCVSFQVAMILPFRNAAIRRFWLTRCFYTKVIPSPTEKKTIYALGTPPGRGGIGVIRVSGPNALDVYSRMVRVGSGDCVRQNHRESPPEPWKMRRCSIVHPDSKEVLDEGMAVFFKGPLFIFCESRFP